MIPQKYLKNHSVPCCATSDSWQKAPRELRTRDFLELLIIISAFSLQSAAQGRSAQAARRRSGREARTRFCRALQVSSQHAHLIATFFYPCWAVLTNPDRHGLHMPARPTSPAQVLHCVARLSTACFVVCRHSSRRGGRPSRQRHLVAIRAEGRGMLGDWAGRAGAQSMLQMIRCMHCICFARGLRGWYAWDVSLDASLEP